MSKSQEDKEFLKSFTNFRRKEQPVQFEPVASSDVMFDARYIKNSSQLISDALQKGFDVLQMANGDIVTTGTKTVVYKYTWDEVAGKLKRTSISGKKANGSELESEEEIVGEALEGVE